ncbi:MAG: glycosyltransferase family 2 protein [Candidatus Polarisedimenticolia bacterium]
MTDRIPVSVVIPAHDAERFLAGTIESALGQTLRPLEVLVVDDGSRDATGKVASSFRPPVRVLQGEGRGVSAARNLGMAAARGEWIAWLDHDDLWEPDKLERQARMVTEDSDAVMVFTQARVEPVDGMAAEPPGIFPLIDDPVRLLEDPLVELAHWNFVPMSSVMTSRAALRELDGPFDTRYHLSEDWDLWLRVARRHPRGLRYVDAPLTRYRIVAGRATRRMGDLRLEDIAIFEELMRSCPGLLESDPRRCRDTRHRLRREAGYWLLKEGRGTEAREHLKEAWRLRPGSLRPLGLLAASLLPGAGRPGGD